MNVIVDNLDEDNIHPTAVILEPASGETVSGNITIETLPTDNIGIQRVEFFIDAELVYTDSIGPDYNYLWVTDSLQDDKEYIISVTAYDFNDNEGPSTPITVYLDNYDNIIPNGTILYPYAGQLVSGSETITVYATDNKGIDKVEFYIDNVLMDSVNSEPFEYIWDTSNEIEDKDYIIGATVVDISNNEFQIPSISVTVNNIPNDTNPPTVIINSPSSGQIVSGTINFSVLANDDSGISYVEFYIDGDLFGRVEEEPFTLIWDTTLDIGNHSNQHTLSAKAEDLAGNVSYTQPILVTVSNE